MAQKRGVRMIALREVVRVIRRCEIRDKAHGEPGRQWKRAWNQALRVALSDIKYRALEQKIAEQYK